MEPKSAARQRHTPASLMTVFADAFKINPDENNFWLQGIYQDRKRRSYRGFYFDRLKDSMSGQIITLKLPEHIKQQVNDGDFYCFRGVLDKDVRWDGVIEPVFWVAELVETAVVGNSAGVDIRARLLQEKASRGAVAVGERLRELLLANKRPQIALICGKTSIVLQDLFAALQETRHQFAFAEQRINLLDKQAILHALAEADDKFDLVAVIRGGGPGLEIFDDVEIAEAGLQLTSPLVTAIGHAQDDTLLQQLADQQFTTPTAFGTFLRETAVTPHHAPPSETAAPTQPILWIALVLIVLILGILLGLALG